jgi:hypothetical protein
MNWQTTKLISSNFLKKKFRFSILFISILLLALPAFATHTSSAELQPEWTTPEVDMNYTVTITNNGPDDVDEVRIYKNADYNNFVCEEKDGWELNFIVSKQACHYIAKDTNHLIKEGANETFYFSARAPVIGCDLNWQFETRDVTQTWLTIYDTTSIDSTPPTTTKIYGLPFFPAGINEGAPYPHWISIETPVTLTAVDGAQNCAIGVDKLYWRNTIVDDVYCEDEIACQEVQGSGDFTEVIGDTTEFFKAEESCHLIEYYSVDKLGNPEEVKKQCVYVDDTPPTATKEVGDPSYYENSTEETDILCYKDEASGWNCYDTLPDALANIGYTSLPTGQVTYENFGPFLKITVEMSGLKPYEDYQLTLNGRNGNDGNDELGNNCANPNEPKSGYEYAWECGFWNGGTGLEGFWNFDMNATTDASGNYTKTYFLHMPDGHYGIGPAHPFGAGFIVKEAADVPGGSNYPPVLMETNGLDWTIDKLQPVWVKKNETQITLSCEDQLPHPVDNEQVCYKVSFDDPEQPWLTQQYCDSIGGVMEGDYCCADVSQSNYTIVFTEESMHDLEYYCRDALGNETEKDLEYFRVDGTPPEISKEMFGNWVGDCPPSQQGDECFVADNGSSGVNISVVDPDPTGNGCNVGNVSCRYWVLWGEGKTKYECNDLGYDYYGEYDGTTWCLVEGGLQGTFGEEGKQVIFREDSKHKLIVKCEDSLGNSVTDIETFLVDSTPPETIKSYGEPFVYGSGPMEWITSLTPVWLDATDEKVGVDKIYWRNLVISNESGWNVCYDPEMHCNPQEYNQWVDDPNVQWNIVEGNHAEFFKAEESCHVIEFYSVDKLNNIEDMKWQCVFVDNTPPTGFKEIGEPHVIKETQGEEGIQVEEFVSQQTPFFLSCKDQGVHPVERETLCYKVSLDNNGYQDITGNYCEPNQNGWCCVEPDFTFYFSEDSRHDLEFYCEDGLGNASEPDIEYFTVDTMAPVITKEVRGPQIGDCPPTEDGDPCIINGVTEILVDAVDPEPHPVNSVTCDWSYIVVDGNASGGQQGVTPPFTINFPEESEHELTITCWDELGNETRDTETFYVDKTPPQIEKWFGDPYYSDEYMDPECTEEECQWFWSEWITTSTPIYASAVDPEPHPSGVKELSYRITLVDDAYCVNGEKEAFNCEDAVGQGDFVPLEEGQEFYAGEESCHLIEVKAVDNVDKESVHKQCVFVDETPPEPVKTVGEPKETWTGADSVYYPEIAEQCWNGPNGLECWKVTLLTPIYLGCNDPEPHPVNNNTVYFYVELDGDNKTSEYCEEYSGDYNANGDGFCKVNEREFYFREESEHNLKYYCVDALGNKGEIDDEKFKVEGTAFTIELNKKWNLVSVPFVLINDSIESVFESVAENLESVWTYDAFTDQWYVYHPDGEAPSNLDSISPGWGYWVRMREPDTLVLGGSLFSPQQTPPSRNLKEGWNLIGHYGTQGEEVYDGPNLNGEGRRARCALYSLGDSYLDKGWTSLLTYWEPDNPDQWKELNYTDYMNPGAGYWISVTEDNLYEYTTNCSGFW